MRAGTENWVSSFEGKKWGTSRELRTEPSGISALARGKEKEIELGDKAGTIRGTEEPGG